MVRAVHGRCGVSGGLFRSGCERPAVASCVYCGQSFCEQHGERGPDYTDTCSRRPCRAKRRDVAEHLAWKQRVYQSNSVSVCAREDCPQRMRHQCSSCRLMFCDEHVETVRMDPYGGRKTRELQIAVCDHCRKRRKLWS